MKPWLEISPNSFGFLLCSALACSAPESRPGASDYGTAGEAGVVAGSGGRGNGLGGESGASQGGNGAAIASGGSGAAIGNAGSGGSSLETYPAGPYGENNPDVGAILENLTFRGYANPTGVGLANEQPLVDYSFADLRSSGPRYALLHIGAVW